MIQTWSDNFAAMFAFAGPKLEEQPEEERADGSEEWSDSEDYDTDLDVDTTVTEMFQGQAQWDQCYSGLFRLFVAPCLAFMSVYTQARTHSGRRSHMHARTHSRSHARTHTHTHTHTEINTHTYTHTHTHTHARTH